MPSGSPEVLLLSMLVIVWFFLHSDEKTGLSQSHCPIIGKVIVVSCPECNRTISAKPQNYFERDC